MTRMIFTLMFVALALNNEAASAQTQGPATPQAQMVLRLDTGTLRLLERHSTALGLSLAGLFWHVAGDIYTTPLSRLRELYAANSEPAEIAYQLLVERGC